MLNVYFYRQDSKDVGSAKAPLALKDLQKASRVTIVQKASRFTCLRKPLKSR